MVDFLYLGQNTGEAAGDVYIGMEGIYGSGHDDTLRGTYSGDTIEGGAGDDVIMGRAGDDHLTGGLGDDILIGGPGADVFIFADGHDEITDFGTGDQIGFDTSSWTGSGWDIDAILATATTSPDGLTFNIDAQNSLTLANITDINQINDDLFMV